MPISAARMPGPAMVLDCVARMPPLFKFSVVPCATVSPLATVEKVRELMDTLAPEKSVAVVSAAVAFTLVFAVIAVAYSAAASGRRPMVVGAVLSSVAKLTPVAVPVPPRVLSTMAQGMMALLVVAFNPAWPITAEVPVSGKMMFVFVATAALLPRFLPVMSSVPVPELRSAPPVPTPLVLRVTLAPMLFRLM